MSEIIRVAPLSELKEKPLCIQHKGVPYVVFRGEKKIRAFVSVCLHEDLAMFPPKFRKGCLVCPFHKVSFDPDSGEVVSDRGKAIPSGLPPVETQVLEKIIYIVAKKKHRQLLPKSERRRVKKEAAKMADKKKGPE
jgi:nitrite reductase/ring-hydroxylating ferredoxin subunit